MSASSKKKLRNAQNAEKLTEKQLTEQKEAKKLKLQSTIFVVVLVLMVCFAAYTAVSSMISGSGIRERSTVALTVGEHEITNAELNYYYIDSVNNFYSQYGSYAAMFGLDVTKPLNENVLNSETGYTWADDFMESAKENIKAVYALNDAAEAAGFTLTEEQVKAFDTQMMTIGSYATLYGYADAEAYLKAMYGNGANEENFRKYYTMTTLASAFQTHYAESLTYTDADLRAAEADNYAEYSAFSYNTYYLAASSFLKGGTTDENGTTVYSAEEEALARDAAETAAKGLAESTSVEELDAAIAALTINAEKENAASSAYVDYSYASINSVVQEWVTDEARVAGDITYIPATSHTHAEGETHSEDEDASAFETVNGYYVVIFNGRNDNTFPLANVRHILLGFTGGSYDAATGTTLYSDEEKAAAKAKAEEVLAAWQAGEATEESFAAMVKDHSTDPGSIENGGLYEDVYPGQMVTNFNDWCFAEGRKAGDTGIVETDYGYHVMFYSADSDVVYRDFLIENALVSKDTNAWYDALLEAVTVTEQNLSYISTDLVLAR